MTGDFIGSPIRRLEDAALLTGADRFVDDIELPGTVEAAFVRSPHPHALIRSVDSSAARNLRGVHAVFSYADLAPLLTKNLIPPDNPKLKFAESTKAIVLAEEEVCYVGEIVAIVLADSRYVAEDAVALIDVTYEVLPSVSDCRDALAPDAPRVHRDAPDNVVARFRTEYGDCRPAFAAAAHVLALSLKQHRGSGHPIEGRGIVAQFDPSTEGLTVWSSTQGSHRVRNTLADTGKHVVRVGKCISFAHVIQDLADEVDQQDIKTASADLDADGIRPVGIQRNRYRRLSYLPGHPTAALLAQKPLVQQAVHDHRNGLRGQTGLASNLGLGNAVCAANDLQYQTLVEFPETALVTATMGSRRHRARSVRHVRIDERHRHVPHATERIPAPQSARVQRSDSRCRRQLTIRSGENSLLILPCVISGIHSCKFTLLDTCFAGHMQLTNSMVPFSTFAAPMLKDFTRGTDRWPESGSTR